MKRFASLLLALVLVLTSFAAIASAVSFAEDAAEEGSITLNVRVEFDDNGNRTQVPLPGLKLNVYRIWSYENAQIDGTVFSGDLNLADYLKDDPVFQVENSMELSFKAKEFAERTAGHTPDYTVETDENGIISLENLPLGGYLFVQPDTLLYKSNNWTLAQFIITLPQMQADGSWATDLNITPKPSMQGLRVETEVRGTKTWTKPTDINYEVNKPITIRLWCNGIEIDSRQLNAQTGWSYAFTGLDKFDDEGKEYVYTITEDTIEGYVTTYNGYDIINSYNPERTQVNVVKTWDDENNTLGYRPASITVHLMRDGERFGDDLVLSYDTGWTGSWTNLLIQAEDGHRYVYTVVEEPVEYYITKIDASNSEKAIIINNIYEPDEFPNTGDMYQPIMYGIILVVSLLAMGILAIDRKRS